MNEFTDVTCVVVEDRSITCEQSDGTLVYIGSKPVEIKWFDSPDACAHEQTICEQCAESWWWDHIVILRYQDGTELNLDDLHGSGWSYEG